MLRRAGSLLAAGAVAAGLTACGASGAHRSAASGPVASGDPATLLRDTFAPSRAVRSGVLALELTITPHGSSQLTAPLSLSLGGPFQSAPGHRPESALTIALSGLGRHSSLGVTTTGSAAYVTLRGTSYRLPAAEFRKLESSTGASGAGSAPGLASLGIDPRAWVSHPRIIGTATVDGVLTEHLHAGVDVRAFVQSLGSVLAKGSSTLGAAAGSAATLPTHLTAAQASRIAAAIEDPTVDIYTGRDDSTLRRLVVDATLPVRGTLSSELGGLASAHLHMSVDYSDIGRPQTIHAPAHARSFTALRSTLEALGQGLAAARTGTSAGSSGRASRYASCIAKANGHVARMQRCAALLGSAG